MVASAAGAYQLPSDLAITDRSRKFYDGTYTWDSDGFTDEHGGKKNEGVIKFLLNFPSVPRVRLSGSSCTRSHTDASHLPRRRSG